VRLRGLRVRRLDLYLLLVVGVPPRAATRRSERVLDERVEGGEDGLELLKLVHGEVEAWREEGGG